VDAQAVVFNIARRTGKQIEYLLVLKPDLSRVRNLHLVEDSAG
jgi:hypothetical protein